MTIPRSILLIFILAGNCSQAQSTFRYGLFYSYGAYWNLHRHNDRPLTPTDGYTFGAFCQLDNGNKALGFRATLGLRAYDTRFRVDDNVYIINELKAVELKLQCTMPITNKSILALGISPRVITHSTFNFEYLAAKNGVRHEERHTIAGVNGNVNALNTAVSFSWYYTISPHWSTALNLDQDMLPSHHDDVVFSAGTPDLNLPKTVSVNGRMTGLTASLIFSVR